MKNNLILLFISLAFSILGKSNDLQNFNNSKKVCSNSSNVETIITNVNICEGETYTWAANGQVYHMSGMYTLADDECDEILNLTVENCHVDIWLEKVVSPNNGSIGDTVIFFVTVGNSGPKTATGVQVLDELPSGYTYINHFETQGKYNLSNGLWDVGVLTELSPQTLSTLVVINTCGDYLNRAEVIAHNEDDLDSAPNNGICEDIEFDFGMIEAEDDCDEAGAIPSQSGLAIGNLVWNDFDNDGLVDSVETGVGGVRVDLYRADIAGDISGPILNTDYTSPNGEYYFSDLTNGDYVVSIPQSNFNSGQPLFGYVESTGRAVTDPDDDVDNVDDGFESMTSFGIISQAVSLISGSEPITEDNNPNTNKTVDFGFVPHGSIGNRVWVDANADGIQDEDEIGLHGVTIELFDLDVSMTESIANQVTDINGFYLFTGLRAGDYFLRFTYPGSHISTLPNATTNDQDSDADDSNGLNTTSFITLLEGQNNYTVDAGVIDGIEIGDYVWRDSNKNGIQDSGEPPVFQMEVGLYNIEGNLLATTLTDQYGRYYFSKLKPSTQYYLSIQDLFFGGDIQDYPTQSNVGDDDQVDSDFTINAVGVPFNLIPKPTVAFSTEFAGQKDFSLDFGLITCYDLFLTDTICESDVYLWEANGQVYEGLSAGNYQFVAPIDGCPTHNILNLVVNEKEADIVANIDLCEGEVFVWNGITYIPGSIITVPGVGCLADQVLIIGSIPQEETIITNATICSTESYTWAANGVTYTVSGQHIITGTGCSGDQVLNLTVESCFIDVWLEKAVSPVSAEVGDTIVFTVTVGNNGPSVATNVQVLDRLPSGYTFLASFATQSVFQVSTGLWNVGTLPVISAHTLSIIVVVNATGEYLNQACVVGHDQVDIDSHPHFQCCVPPIDYASDYESEMDNCDEAGAIPINAGLELGNLVWNDFDNDGFLDFNEPGVPGVQVDLYSTDAEGNPTGSILQTTFTDPNGEYCFAGLIPGDYVVAIPISNFTAGNALSGYLDSTGRAVTDPDDDVDNVDDGFYSATALGLIAQAVTLVSEGEPTTEDGNPNSNKTIDFGVVPNGSIGNKVWIDSDSDGVQDQGEVGLPGTYVELFDLSVSSTSPIANRVTDVNGCYLFAGLDAGDYFVRFNYPGNYSSTTPNATNDSQDSDVDGANGQKTTATITIGQGQNDLTVDAGVVGGALIGNYTWCDTDGSVPNVQDANDAALPGVIVNLYCNDPILGNYMVGTSVTDVKGEYYFNNVAPSDLGMSYYLEFVPPSGYSLVGRDVGGNDSIDSDPDQVTGTTLPFLVNPGELKLSFDAGYERVLALNNTAFAGEYNEETNSTLLTWVTDSEEDIDYYILEKAFNSGDFRELVKVNALKVNAASYIELDNDLSRGTHYYRLTKVTVHGEYQQGNVVAIAATASYEQSSVTLFPNPVDHLLYVKVSNADQHELQISLVNAQGIDVMTKRSRNADLITIDCSELMAGVYFLMTSINGTVSIEKLTVI